VPYDTRLISWFLRRVVAFEQVIALQMILRRFKENIRRQDWFSVWIEILAVVFGVFLALQADNWNERRLAGIEELDYLSRLHADITASAETAIAAIGYMNNHARRANVVLRSLKECSISQEDRLDFANGLFQLGNIVPPYLADGTIRELRSTGKETVIRNAEIRTQLNNLLAQRQYYGSFFPIVAGRVEPHVVYVHSKVRFLIDDSNAGTQEISWEEAEFDLKELCGDKRFHSAVSASRTISYDTVFWSERELNLLEELSRNLRTELESRGYDPSQH